MTLCDVGRGLRVAAACVAVGAARPRGIGRSTARGLAEVRAGVHSCPLPSRGSPHALGAQVRARAAGAAGRTLVPVPGALRGAWVSGRTFALRLRSSTSALPERAFPSCY